MTDSGNGSRVWRAIGNVRANQSQRTSTVPSDFVDLGFHCAFACNLLELLDEHTVGLLALAFAHNSQLQAPKPRCRCNRCAGLTFTARSVARPSKRSTAQLRPTSEPVGRKAPTLRGASSPRQHALANSGRPASFNMTIGGERGRSPPLPEIMQSRFPHVGNSLGSTQPECNG